MSTKLRKDIYKNIIKSGLHRASIKTPILPCLDVIVWITRKVDHENRAVLNFEDKSVASYKASLFNEISFQRISYQSDSRVAEAKE